MENVDGNQGRIRDFAVSRLMFGMKQNSYIEHLFDITVLSPRFFVSLSARREYVRVQLGEIMMIKNQSESLIEDIHTFKRINEWLPKPLTLFLEENKRRIVDETDLRFQIGIINASYRTRMQELNAKELLFLAMFG